MENLTDRARLPLAERPATLIPQYERLIRAVLDQIDLPYGDGVVKVDSYDPEAVPEGDGVITAEITKVEEPNPGLPDYFVSVSVLGFTFVSVDPDKRIVRHLFDVVLNDVSRLIAASRTPKARRRQRFEDHLPLGARLAGVREITNAAVREGEDKTLFTVDFQLVITDWRFYNEAIE